MDLWIVGEVSEDNSEEWGFVGVFSTEQQAVDACYNERCFVAPATLDEKPEEESVEWPGAYYPSEK